MQKHGEPSTVVVAADDVRRAEDRIPAGHWLGLLGLGGSGMFRV